MRTAVESPEFHTKAGRASRRPCAGATREKLFEFPNSCCKATLARFYTLSSAQSRRSLVVSTENLQFSHARRLKTTVEWPPRVSSFLSGRHDPYRTHEAAISPCSHQAVALRRRWLCDFVVALLDSLKLAVGSLYACRGCGAATRARSRCRP